MDSTTDSFGYTESTDCTENDKFQVYSLEELRHYDGTYKDRPLLLAIDGKVFDVSKGKEFYGPGGAYHTFAGRDATRGMCKFEVNPSDEPLDKKNLTKTEADSLKNWLQFYEEKYHIVGRLMQPRPPRTPPKISSESKDKNQDSTSCSIL